jgi:hypothetical protein
MDCRSASVPSAGGPVQRAPRYMQVPFMQVPPSAQKLSGEQQAWPTPPQATHWPEPGLQTVFDSVQVAPKQHCWPIEPQLPQLPALQMMFWKQAEPDATQTLPPMKFGKQQPPLLHALPSQQGCIGPPQAWQVLPPPGAGAQRVFGAEQELLAQHGWPAPPQAPQLPAAQLLPLPHDEPLATHLLATQQPPASHALPLQHAAPAAPHAPQVGLLQIMLAPQLCP